MIKPELYHKTVGILYDAYFNDTLEHANCYACAVGNLIAANCGYGFKKAETEFPEHQIYWDSREFNAYAFPGELIDQDKDMWNNAFGFQRIHPELFTPKMLQEMNSTGYSPIELAQIEYAFEAVYVRDRDEQMFRGLCQVLEILKEIHQVTDEDLLTANNKRFKDHYNKRVSTV